VNDETFDIKLCDFGFARLVQEGDLLSPYVATRWYRPPELILGSRDYTPTVDTWAGACIMAFRTFIV